MPSNQAGKEIPIKGHDMHQLWWTIRVWLLVLSTFVPYFGVGLGSSTNLPLSSVAACLLLNIALRNPRILIAFIVITLGPAALALMHALLGMTIPNSSSIVVWPFHVAPLFGFAAVAMRDLAGLILPVKIGVAFSAGYALIQKPFLEAGFIPFLGYYDLPGYASVALNAEVIIRYIRRPFGLFPEPSFMAGTLALAVATMVVLRYRLSARLNLTDMIAIGLGIAAIYLSDSGSGLASIGLVLFMAVWPSVRGARRIVLAVIVLAGSMWLAGNVLDSRGSAQNYSWSDRSASIIGALRYVVSSDMTALLGAGKGASPGLFRSGAIPLEGLQYFTVIPDVFSVVGRMLLEFGLVFGLGLTLFLVVYTFRVASLRSGYLMGAVLAVVWITIAGLTISYETASWVWVVPGIGLGLSTAASESRSALLASNSSQRVSFGT